jgi:hypothetical protein
MSQQFDHHTGVSALFGGSRSRANDNTIPSSMTCGAALAAGAAIVKTDSGVAIHNA